LVETVRAAPAPPGERVTLSAGFFVVHPDDVALEPAELVRRADAALYTAKRAGKDRVIVDAREPAIV
ncbi:MAG TPA: hypothetical protein VNP72_04925, partial [Longimicrobium sp.]|nr:hypothetical protein [Longimicrobium sp.]